MDDVGARALTDALRELKAVGAALILVTHHVSEGLSLASDASIMLNGRVVLSERAGDAASFAERYRALVEASSN